MAKLDLTPGQLSIVREVLEKYVPGREVLAFGSRVTGKARKFSDLDLAVMGDEPTGLSVMASLNEAFTESDLPFKVDIVDWPRTTDTFREVIRQESVVVVSGGR